MSYKILGPAWETDLPASQKILLISLSDQANDEGICWPSIASLMRRTGLQERTVYKHLMEIESLGHITRQQRNGKSTIYHIHPCTTCTPVKNDTHVMDDSDPCTTCTPPLHHVHPTPAPRAPITVIEPKEEPKEEKTKTRKRVNVEQPKDVPSQIWNDFLAIRKAKHSPLTETALNRIRAEADKASIKLEQALAVCCERGWQGYRADWDRSSDRAKTIAGKFQGIKIDGWET